MGHVEWYLLVIKIDDRERKKMHTAKVRVKRIDWERVMIALGMALMEASGMFFLICGLTGFRPF